MDGSGNTDWNTDTYMKILVLIALLIGGLSNVVYAGLNLMNSKNTFEPTVLALLFFIALNLEIKD